MEIFRDADHISAPVPSGTVSGSPVRLGGLTGLNGVTQTDRANTSVAPFNPDGTKNTAYNFGGGNMDGNATVSLKGGHEFTVDFEVAALFAPVYIVVATNALTATSNSGANPLYGHALSTKAAAAGPLTVRIAN